MSRTKYGGTALVVFLTSVLFLGPLSISYAECKLPREIAGLRLGDTKEAVLAICNTLREVPIQNLRNVMYTRAVTTHRYWLIHSSDIPSMQLECLEGSCTLGEGGSFFTELFFARNKLFRISCTMRDTSIGLGIRDKINEKYGECLLVEAHPKYSNIAACYGDSDTYWEIAALDKHTGQAVTDTRSYIFVDDVPTIKELVTAANKVDESMWNKERKKTEDMIKGFIK